jgi:hypothetical protein
MFSIYPSGWADYVAAISHSTPSYAENWELYQEAKRGGYEESFEKFNFRLAKQINVPLSLNSTKSFMWHTWINSYDVVNHEFITYSEKVFHTATLNPSGGWAPNYTNRVGGLDYVGYGVDGTGYAAELTAKTTYKYGQRVNGVVKSAAQLTKENAAICCKVATRLNVAGGVIDVVDCGVQSYDDFSNGNYGLGAYEATKAASYTTGTIMLFTPLAPIGAGILLVTGIVDIAGDVGLYIYGRNQ